MLLLFELPPFVFEVSRRAARLKLVPDAMRFVSDDSTRVGSMGRGLVQHEAGEKKQSKQKTERSRSKDVVPHLFRLPLLSRVHTTAHALFERHDFFFRPSVLVPVNCCQHTIPSRDPATPRSCAHYYHLSAHQLAKSA